MGVGLGKTEKSNLWLLDLVAMVVMGRRPLVAGDSVSPGWDVCVILILCWAHRCTQSLGSKTPLS